LKNTKKFEKTTVGIGRNDPCPCGSGRKYKKCCGAMGVSIDTAIVNYRVIQNGRKAFSGILGAKRKEYLENYSKEKMAGIREVEQEQRAKAKANNESLSCRKGCNYCCYFFTQATRRECEAIAFYLFHHENVLRSFIDNYPAWRMEVQKTEERLLGLSNIHDKTELIDQLKNALSEYHKLNVPCPFLVDGSCSIHEVRPWVCVSVISVTPREWCGMNDPNYANVKYYSSEVMLTKEPALSQSARIESISSTMPASVFSILRDGFTRF
jgi:Fe-S-cluster containining protein